MNKCVYVIAEAGVNHNGDVQMAHQLIDAAVEANVDAVKFQTWKTEYVSRPGTALVEYQKGGKMGKDMFELGKMIELEEADFKALSSHCEEAGVDFISTPFDTPALHFLARELNVSVIKIPSGEAVNVPFLRDVAATGLPVILSTGMCELDEIRLGIDTLNKVWNGARATPTLTLLQCTTAYPTPPQDIHLRAMETLKTEFGLPVGFSDHSEGIAAATAAVALGAEIIEKHFTLDRTLPGPDHQASLEPNELTEMVAAIRTVEQALGSADKTRLDIEHDVTKQVRRSLVARQDIKKGAVISQEMLIALRPEDGIAARYIDDVVGKAAWRDFDKGEVLQWDA
jgi:N,N'-diacetyllegionaminate synthase